MQSTSAGSFPEQRLLIELILIGHIDAPETETVSVCKLVDKHEYFKRLTVVKTVLTIMLFSSLLLF